MKRKSIGRNLARRMALVSQICLPSKKHPAEKRSLFETISHLSYIQIDTISVIARAHHHTLWTRLPDYQPQMLADLQAKDRVLFEYWGHAASYLPMADYRFYLPRMRKAQEPPTSKWDKKRLESCGHLLEPVLERIRKEGALSSKDFSPPPVAKAGPWWGWKPAKIALELLYWQGKLMISSRNKFQKLYDLTERVLPPNIDTTYPTDNEFGRWLVQRALRSYGVARESEIRQHIYYSPKEIVARSLDAMIESGEVTPVTIGNDSETTYYGLTDFLAQTGRIRQRSPQLFILSPFDNLVILRNRITRLWDFDYTLECYVPASKRKFGYFVLPVLWGERFVARFDPHVDRKQSVFSIRRFYLEPDFVWDDAFVAAFAKKLVLFAIFNDCLTINIEWTSPANVKGPLTKEIKAALGRAIS